MKKGQVISYATKKGFDNSNNKIINQYRELLINNQMISEEEDLILVSKEEMLERGGKLKEDAIPISINCPPDEKHDSSYKQFFYPLSQIEGMKDYIVSDNISEQEDIEEQVENEKVIDDTENNFTEDDISYKNVLIPYFSVMTDKGFNSYTDCIVDSYDNINQNYTIKTGNDKTLIIPKDTLNRIFKNQQLQEQLEQQKKEEVAIATGVGIVFQDLEHGIHGTTLPDFSLIDEQRTGGILKSFSNFVVQSYNNENESYVISNGDTDLVLKKEELEEIVTSDRLKNISEKSPKYEKLLQTQYEDFFKARDNTAANFIHNFEVYCRKDANSPLDSVQIAKQIISKMPKREQKKTKSLLNEVKGKKQTITEALVDMYNNAVKVVPLNEKYIESTYPNKFIPRTYYDTVSNKGTIIGNFEDLKKINKLDPSKNEDRNLRIGDTLTNIKLPVDKTFGKGKQSIFFEELTVVSSSKEKNAIYLKNKDKSIIEVPRDTFLDIHRDITRKQLKQEAKAETKMHKPKKNISFEMER